MARQIIKQPNGKYCIFSTIVDNVTHYDMSVDDIIEEWVSEYKTEITKTVKNIVDKLERGEKPYHQSTQSYDEMLDSIQDIHGDEAYNEIKTLIENEENEKTELI